MLTPHTPHTPRIPSAPRTLNIGILAHVDAGKTSLTERLLFDTGTIDRLGSVDAGSTQTDTGAIERERGITVRSAVASFTVGATQVNLIDTPGHADFIAEVERAIGVLDGAVLVLSAVEGVQAQTRVLMRTLHETRLPTLVFVNKIDRAGARRDGLLADIRRKLAPHIVPMTAVRDIGTRSARALPESFEDPAFGGRAAETLADTDDALLARVVDGPFPSPGELRAALADRTAKALVHPVYFGSALNGEGVADLVDGIARLLPPANDAAAAPVPDAAERASDGGVSDGDASDGDALDDDVAERASDGDAGDRASDGAAPVPEGAEPHGTVFAVERGPSGEKTAYLRLFSGALTLRQRVTLYRRRADGTYGEHPGQITSLQVVGAAGTRTNRLTAGNIGRIRGLPGVRVGDRLGLRDGSGRGDRSYFSRPVLQTLVRPREGGPGPAALLHTALVSLAEQDPLIHARAEPGGATSVLLYGEIQKEIIAATLARDYGVDAVFEPSRIVCLERPDGVGEAYEGVGRRAPAVGGFWATVGLRVEPGAPGTGAVFRYETELGALPRAFHHAIEETVHAALRHGPQGWAVTDCVVTLIRSGFVAPVSTAGDFRGLTPVVLAHALERAGTRVYEPYHAFEAEVPADAVAAVTTELAALGADIEEVAGGTAGWLLKGMVAAGAVREVERRLPAVSRGEGVWWSRPCGDRPRA